MILTIIYNYIFTMNSSINVTRSRVQCSFQVVAKKILVNIKRVNIYLIYFMIYIYHVSRRMKKWRKSYRNCESYTYGRTHRFHQGTKSFRLYPYPICIECIALKLNLSVIFIFISMLWDDWKKNSLRLIKYLSKTLH